MRFNHTDRTGNRTLGTVLLASASLLLPATLGHGQIVLDGDFDDLPLGPPPDCDAPAGAWGWPDSYVMAGFCETDPSQFTVAVEPGGAGHCLHHHVDLDSGQPNANMFLPNVFQTVIEEAADPLTIVVFDIMVPEAGVSGGSIFVGGDHGGNGWSHITDRAVQVGWQSEGALTVSGLPDPTFDCPEILVEQYPLGTWQTVRLEIDLVTDTFDMFWAERGDPLVQLLDDRVFHHAANLDHLDRFTVWHADVVHPCIEFGSTHSFLDNLLVSVCLADATLDGVVDFADILAVLSSWGTGDPAADIDNDGIVSFSDLLVVLSEWGSCS